LDLAIIDLNRAITIDPINVTDYYFRGLVKYKQDDTYGAVADFDRQIDILNRDNLDKTKQEILSECLFSKGVIKLYEFKDYKGALQDANSAIKWDEKNSKAYFLRGKAKIKLGFKESGWSDYYKAKELGYPLNIENLEKRGDIISRFLLKVQPTQIAVHYLDIKAKDISVVFLNQKRKETTRIHNIDKLRICFTLRENPIATPGEKEVFMRIIRPDSRVITTSPDNLFEYNGNKLVYSASRLVDFVNQGIEMCIFLDNNDDFIIGDYKVELYIENNIIGSTTFSLLEMSILK
jgi:tetratricopeptide (TPR) repeat protein